MNTRTFLSPFAVLAGGLAMLAACGGDDPGPDLNGGASNAGTVGATAGSTNGTTVVGGAGVVQVGFDAIAARD